MEFGVEFNSRRIEAALIDVDCAEDFYNIPAGARLAATGCHHRDPIDHPVYRWVIRLLSVTLVIECHGINDEWFSEANTALRVARSEARVEALLGRLA